MTLIVSASDVFLSLQRYVLLISSQHLVVEMNMNSTRFLVAECDCNISICVEFTDGILERNVSVSLSTEQGTATNTGIDFFFLFFVAVLFLFCFLRLGINNVHFCVFYNAHA